MESVNSSSPNGGSGLANGTSEWQIDGLALAQGVNLVTVEATDEAGNLGSVEVSVVSDPSAPFESALRLLAPEPESGEGFGYSVAVDDSFAVVGATGGRSILPGEVHVFKRGVGGWVHETQLIPSIHPGPTFGCTVAISGERIVIGNCSSNETTVVFERISGEWLETAVLPAIGRAVALDDDVAVVGDFLSREVLVFRYSGSEWKMEDRLFIDTYQWYYGFAVAVDSNRIAVGAPLANDFFDASGSAYVYSFNGSEWLLNARLLPSQPRLYGRFGHTVAIADESLPLCTWRKRTDERHLHFWIE